VTAALDHMPRADQAYRIARQVRIDHPRAPVHRVLRSAFSRPRGHAYETCCGGVLAADHGAILTTRDVTCSGCTPGWKAN
jgi:hypothetical protein